MDTNATTTPPAVPTRAALSSPTNVRVKAWDFGTLTAGLSAAVYLSVRSELPIAARLTIGVGIVLAAVAANHDRTNLRLPNSLVAGVALAAIAAGAIGSSLPAVAIGAGIAASPLLLVHLLEPHALGFGDVKYAAATGGLLGAVSINGALILITVTLIGAVVNRALHPTGARPLGPIILIGVVVAATVIVTLQQEGWIS